MRRLPIYFLIDVSESMVGEPIKQVQAGMETIVKELRMDPHALETVYLSIIAFAGRTQKLSSLTEIYNFYPPQLPIGGGTSLGAAMNFLMDDMDKSIIKTTLEQKGDWKPLVFLFTDGVPTDSVDLALERWNTKYKKSANLVAISLGSNADTRVLSRLTEDVLRLNTTDATSFKSFFKWITDSIKSTSTSIGETSVDQLKLRPFDDDFLTKIELEMSVPETIDENCAVMLAKCQNKQQLYLIKYEKVTSTNPYSQYVSRTRGFNLTGAYPIDNNYFELSDAQPLGVTVNTAELNGFPHCPCCGNQYGFSQCRCGRLLCVGNEEISHCPWCAQSKSFSMAEGDSDISRTRG